MYSESEQLSGAPVGAEIDVVDTVSATSQEAAEVAEQQEAEQPEAEQPPADQLAAAPDVLRPALKQRGFESLTAVQQAILDADDDASDLRITSQTGSGKTVALGFALINRLTNPARKGPTTLVIAPTRELAMQVKEELGWLFADLANVHCEVVTGGTSIGGERQRLRRRPTVLVGTPGRLLDHLREHALDVSSVTQLVLDEADQMLDLGFKDELDGILAQIPAERRTHLVSATFPREVLDLADRFQKRPIHIQGTAAGEAHGDIEHVAYRIGNRDHYAALVNLLLLAGEDRTLVFVRTREDTTTLADKLAADGFQAMPLNGDLAQAQRTRTLAAFRAGTVRTLVATDVAARGLDINSVMTVVHVDPPIDSATYTHRSGRTGRAGQKGTSVMFVTKAAEGRARRLYREARVEPMLEAVPTADLVLARQLERGEAKALATIESSPAAAPEMLTAAQNLLRDRDAAQVVAVLLQQTMSSARAPFDIHSPFSSPPPRRDRTTRDLPSSKPLAPVVRQPLPAGRRGEPGAPPSWRRGADEEAPAARDNGEFVRFRINWGFRDGADPRRILAHVCRRGDVDSRAVGDISMSATASTFEVHSDLAFVFAKKVQKPDRRDPHLFIVRDDARRVRPSVARRQHA